MSNDIEVIFIDVGNTLRVLVEDEPYQEIARHEIATLVGTQEEPKAFCEMLDKRYKVYRKYAFETLIEAPERELWTRWMLPDYPAETIAPLSGDLTFLYRQTMGRRFAQPDTRQVLQTLSERGYRMGIISNTITEREIPNWLKEDGLNEFFPVVILSSIVGCRKPGAEIFHLALKEAGIEASQAAYVGDNPIRDVAGARSAGFGKVIIMLDAEEFTRKTEGAETMPDHLITTLSDLLDICPPREK